MNTYTKEGMPPNYWLIRYGLFNWGWYRGSDNKASQWRHWTANGAKKIAWDIYQTKLENDLQWAWHEVLKNTVIGKY